MAGHFLCFLQQQLEFPAWFPALSQALPVTSSGSSDEMIPRATGAIPRARNMRRVSLAQKRPKPPNTWTLITTAMTTLADLLYVQIFFMFQFIAANVCCLYLVVPNY
jgi:hypothetical protein